MTREARPLRRPAIRRPSAGTLGAATIVTSLLFIVGGIAPRAEATSPTLPLAFDGKFLAFGPAGPVAPGTSTGLPFNMTNPLAAAITGVVLTFGLYAFNGYPGNATGAVPAANSPTLSNDSASGALVQERWASLLPGQTVSSSGGPLVTFIAPSQASEGTYAIRTQLSFTENGTAYVLESIGYFSKAVWESATGGSGGSYNASTLNLTRLGVSGIIPETGILVRSNPYPIALYTLLGVGLVLAGAGSYVAVRRGPGSTSGARVSPDDQKAPNAFGNKRTSEGD